MELLSGMIYKVVVVFISVMTMLGVNPGIDSNSELVTKDKWKTDYPYVLVAGYKGSGEYDFGYDAIPYWGCGGTNVAKYMTNLGFETHAASVDSTGSTWDRACELYAQLTGTVVDYGKAHSEKYGHNRYGTDYSKDKLIDYNWSKTNKLNFVGHSFGGNTVLMFLDILADGSSAEKKATTDGTLSSFFKGGKGSWINAVVTYSSPINGTSLTLSSKGIDALENLFFQYTADSIIAKSDFLTKQAQFNFGTASKIVFNFTSTEKNVDNAVYDMNPDVCAKYNKSIQVQSNVYYFSCMACTTKEDPDTGYLVPKSNSDIQGVPAAFIGMTLMTTEGGIKINKSWLPNDGLVNVISARAPFGAKQKDYKFGDSTSAGVWNKFAVVDGQHTHYCASNSKALTFDVTLFNTINML